MKNKKVLSLIVASLLLGTGSYAQGNGKYKVTQNKQNKSKKGKNMNKNIRNGLIAASATMLIGGCGSSGNGSNGNTTPVASVELPAAVADAIASERSILSQELTNTLAYMGNEERLAYDVYNELYRQYGTKQFTNIATKSEYKHIIAVQGLIQKYKLSDDVNFTNVDLPALGYMNTAIEDMEAGTYDIAVIQRLYDDLVAQGSVSEVEALKVGCMIEVLDVNDLLEDLVLANNENATDLVTVFGFLLDGSYNHYWAFDKGLKNKGISDGCCVLGTEYCHPEYP